MLIQQTLIQYLLQKKNLCDIFKVLTIWGNINLFIRPQHLGIQASNPSLPGISAWHGYGGNGELPIFAIMGSEVKWGVL